jgi:hypothetical protein
MFLQIEIVFTILTQLYFTLSKGENRFNNKNRWFNSKAWKKKIKNKTFTLINSSLKRNRWKIKSKAILISTKTTNFMILTNLRRINSAFLILHKNRLILKIFKIKILMPLEILENKVKLYKSLIKNLW